MSLGTLFLAAQFLDLLWPTLLLTGWEQVAIQPGVSVVTPLDFISYPISHSLLLAMGWGVLLGFGYWCIRKKTTAAMLVACCVLSHWVLDLIVHRPDLPLYPGNAPRLGLGLWDSLPATLLVEGALFLAGVYFYVRSTRPLNKRGLYGLWALLVFLVLVYLANLFGPSPASIRQIAWAAQLQWLLVLWAWWADRNRVPISRHRPVGYFAS